MGHRAAGAPAELPDDTKLYCAHEYTLSNARFAVTAEPENRALAERVEQVAAAREAGQITLPSTVSVTVSWAR